MSEIYHMGGSMRTEREVAKAINIVNAAIDDGLLIQVGEEEAERRGITRQYLWILVSTGAEAGYKVGDRWYIPRWEGR